MTLAAFLAIINLGCTAYALSKATLVAGVGLADTGRTVTVIAGNIHMAVAIRIATYGAVGTAYLIRYEMTLAPVLAIVHICGLGYCYLSEQNRK